MVFYDPPANPLIASQCYIFRSRKELSGGNICVMGGEPGDRQLGLPGPLVGFMPQSIRLFLACNAWLLFAWSLIGWFHGFGFVSLLISCLLSLAMEFTIKETFAYFGRLLNLKSELVALRQNDLLQLLQLGDNENRQVKRDVHHHRLMIQARCGS